MGNSSSSGAGGSSGSKKVTSNDKAVLDLKVQRDKIKQYQRRIQLNLETDRNNAKLALAAGNKSRALTALRQRKHQESLLSKTDDQLFNLNELLSTIEFSMVQSQVVASLQKGSNILKELQQEMSLEKVQNVMDESREGIERQREIDEALMSQMSPDEEEAVQEEFRKLQEVIGLGEAQNVGAKMPQVPTAALPTPVMQEEEAEPTPTRHKQREEDLMVAMTS